jgi:hypothetical protein
MKNSNNVMSEISNRINKGNKCCYGLRNILSIAFLSKDARRKIHIN